jgi:hypothetical protein
MNLRCEWYRDLETVARLACRSWCHVFEGSTERMHSVFGAFDDEFSFIRIGRVDGCQMLGKGEWFLSGKCCHLVRIVRGRQGAGFRIPSSTGLASLICQQLRFGIITEKILDRDLDGVPATIMHL